MSDRETIATLAAVAKFDCQNEFAREHNSALSYIASDAKWTRYGAENITRHINLLRVIPGFETKAADELKNAQLALREALLAVSVAIQTLQGSAQLQAAE